jgi:hypothetical protein
MQRQTRIDEVSESNYSDDTRNFKGYWFEIMVCKPKFEAIPSTKYECNPSSYEYWKHLQGNNPIGYDAVITLPNGKQLRLEFKFRAEGGIVYHNWFMRDWLPRDADIYVTNNVEAISYNDKRELETKGKKLMSLSEAVVYISRLVHNILHPNQYVYWNSLITNIISKICSRTIKITSKMINLKLKIKLKISLFSFVASVKSGLSISAEFIHSNIFRKTHTGQFWKINKERSALGYRLCLSNISSSSFYASFRFFS